MLGDSAAKKQAKNKGFSGAIRKLVDLFKIKD